MRNHWKFYTYISFTTALLGCDVSISGDGEENPDAVIFDFPIAYVERPIPLDEDGNRKPNDVLDPADFNPGAKIIVKARASVPALSTVITEGLFTPIDGETEALYDVKDLSISPDGATLLFAMRAPEDPDADDEDQPKWNIWEYVLETNEIYSVISEPAFAEEGDDVNPYYLPSGEIVFSSNRQDRSKAILLDERKPQFIAQRESSDGDQNEDIFNIHIMSSDGNDIRQITFNQNQDIQPRVLDTGEIVFLRHDSYEGGNDRTSLYRINPDGSNLSLYYGYHSQDTGTDGSDALFAYPKLTADNRLLVSLRASSLESLGGDIALIDAKNFTENNQPTTENTGALGPAQESITQGDVSTNDTTSSGGYYSSAHRIFDGTDRLLISWSPCLVDGFQLGIYVNSALQLIDDQGQFVNHDGNSTDTAVTIEADDVRTLPCTDNTLATPAISISDPLYGIWIYDPATQTQSPVTLATTDTVYTEAVVFDIRAEGEGSPSSNIDTELAADKLGVMHIRSVYDIDGVDSTDDGIIATSDPLQTAVDDRPVRFIRLIKAVSIPSDDFLDFDAQSLGFGSPLLIKDILGYVPVEPDGSAKFVVPANVAFTISLLDGQGRKLGNNDGGRHRNWLSVREGETFECLGCHTSDSEAPHGRLDAQAASVNPGATGLNFPNSALTTDANGNLADIGFPILGESMAEYYARSLGPRVPSLNLAFTDDWSDETVIAKAENFDWNFADLDTPAPVTLESCITTWEASCRTIINYLDHIQPIWELERPVFVGDMMAIQTLSCVSCHNINSLPMDNAGNQLTQLLLTSEVSAENNLFVTSYVELLRTNLILETNSDTETAAPVSGTALARDPDTDAVIYETMEEVVDGLIVVSPILDSGGHPIPEVGPIVCDDDTDDIDRLVLADATSDNQSVTERIQYLTSNGTYSNDPTASFNNDSLGDRIPLTENEICSTGAILNAGSARGARSQAFFNLFEDTGSYTGSLDHASFLTQAELKLLTEWIDIGAKYYNNPFAAPLD